MYTCLNFGQRYVILRAGYVNLLLCLSFVFGPIRSREAACTTDGQSNTLDFDRSAAFLSMIACN